MATDQEVTLAFRQPNTGQTFAFVQFEQQESANTALTLTGMQLGERAIKINPAKLPPTLRRRRGAGRQRSPGPRRRSRPPWPRSWRAIRS